MRHGPACSCTPWLSEPSAVPVPGSHLPRVVDGVLFFTAPGVSHRFSHIQSLSCSGVETFGGFEGKEGLSCLLSIIPPSLSRAFQIFQPGLALSPKLLPAPDLSPGQSLFECPFLSPPASSRLIPKYHFFFFPLFLSSNKLYIPADLQTQSMTQRLSVRLSRGWGWVERKSQTPYFQHDFAEAVCQAANPTLL